MSVNGRGSDERNVESLKPNPTTLTSSSLRLGEYVSSKEMVKPNQKPVLTFEPCNTTLRFKFPPQRNSKTEKKLCVQNRLILLSAVCMCVVCVCVRVCEFVCVWACVCVCVRTRASVLVYMRTWARREGLSDRQTQDRKREASEKQADHHTAGRQEIQSSNKPGPGRRVGTNIYHSVSIPNWRRQKNRSQSNTVHPLFPVLPAL